MLVIAYGSYDAVELSEDAVSKLEGYVYLVNDTLKLWEAGKAVAHAEGLTPTECNECFYDWCDAVTGCGVDIEATVEFHDMLDTAITDYKIWS